MTKTESTGALAEQVAAKILDIVKSRVLKAGETKQIENR